MKRNIIIALILLLIIIAGLGIIYLNNVYLPVKFKSMLIQTLENNLGYNAKISDIKYNLIKGLVIKDIVIYDQVEDAQNTLLKVKEIYFNFLFLPLIKQGKIIIPVIHIDSPFFNLRYQKDRCFNFAKIFSFKIKPPQEKSRFSFFIYKIHLFDGQAILQDERFEPAFTKTLTDLNIGLSLKPIAKISFLIQTKVLWEKNLVGKLSAKGSYDLLAKELNAELDFANLIFNEFSPYLETFPFLVNNGAIESSKLNLNFKKNIIDLDGVLSLRKIELKKDDYILSADIDIYPQIKYTIDTKEFFYKANLKILGANLEGIKYLKKINQIKGDIALTKDYVFTDNLNLETLGIPFIMRGSLKNFFNPYIKINFSSSQCDLEKLFPIFSLPTELKLTGLAKVNIDIEGELKNPPLNQKISFDLENALFQSPVLKEPLKNISGRINLNPEGLDWQNLSFNYRNIIYQSSGTLSDFKEPKISFNLNSSDLNLKSDLKIKDKIAKISTLNGKYLNSLFDIKGEINFQQLHEPIFDLNTKINLNLVDTFGFLPEKIAQNLRKAKLNGILNLVGSLNGKGNNFKDWQMSFLVNADLISLYELKLRNFSFNLQEKDGLLNINRLNSSFYEGIINIEFLSDLKPEIPTYLIKFNLENIDLAKLKLDTAFKDKDISGILNIQANLEGNFKELSSLKGLGNLSIKEGKLWELNLFRGLAELFLLPDYERIIFNQAVGDFIVENNYLATDNIRLESPQLILDWTGKLGFDGSLDFTIYSKANKEIIRESADLRKFITAVIGELSQAIAIKLTGTLDKPKFKVIPLPLEIIKTIKDFLLGR